MKETGLTWQSHMIAVRFLVRHESYTRMKELVEDLHEERFERLEQKIKKIERSVVAKHNIGYDIPLSRLTFEDRTEMPYTPSFPVFSDLSVRFLTARFPSVSHV